MKTSELHTQFIIILALTAWHYEYVSAKVVKSNEIRDSTEDEAIFIGNSHEPYFKAQRQYTYNGYGDGPHKIDENAELVSYQPRRISNQWKTSQSPRKPSIIKNRPYRMKTRYNIENQQKYSSKKHPGNSNEDDLTMSLGKTVVKVVPAHHGIHVESSAGGHRIHVHPKDFGHKIQIVVNEPKSDHEENELAPGEVFKLKDDFPSTQSFLDSHDLNEYELQKPYLPVIYETNNEKDKTLTDTFKTTTLSTFEAETELSNLGIEVTTDPNLENLSILFKTTPEVIDENFLPEEITTEEMERRIPFDNELLQTEGSGLDSRDVEVMENVPLINLDDVDEEFQQRSDSDVEIIWPEESSGGEPDINEEFDAREEFSVDNEDPRPISGRVLEIFSRLNASVTNCTTPKDEPGHCRSFRHCLLPQVLSNFNLFLQYICLVRGSVVGICCPDNPVVEVPNVDGLNTTVPIGMMELKQPPEGCGLGTKTRIVGGTISQPHEWTWMVALMRRNRFFCGGVIINNWYILTAAHCVMGVNIKDIKVRLGEYNFNIQNEHQRDISVAEIKRHAQFITLTFQHDIALLKLRQRVEYSKFVGTICLPNQSKNFANVSATVVGWGTVSFGGAASPILRQVTIPVWSNKECDQTYLLENINESFMCAGSPKSGEDACQGDSGGPLMTVNERGRWEVIGLVSWGRRCGDPTYPGVYTRVSTYLDWIQNNLD